MATSFKNGVSLHRLLETAPLSALQSFLQTIEQGARAAEFASLPWVQLDADDGDPMLRAQLVSLGNRLAPESAMPLDRHAQRILTLAEGHGAETVFQVSQKLFDQAGVAAFAAQRDDLGRSLWLYQHEPELFDEAESLFYSEHYRNFGRMYEAYELAADIADTADAFKWDDAVGQALETQIQRRLELTGRCSVTHLEVVSTDSQEAEVPQHLIIVRHGGPLSSLPEFQEQYGRRAELYYRPLNEATLLYSPAEGVIEVFCASPSVRQRVAVCFAEIGLKINLSEKPLTLKQYNLSRFLTSLRLDMPAIAGFDLEQVAVVNAEVRPDNPRHRAGLQVTLHDDIEEVAMDLFGENNLFTRATSVARVVIAVRYTQHGTSAARTLNITLSEPNRCNLRSNRDPVQRDLGYALLKAWGILRQVQPLDTADERRLFPALLALFDQTAKEVSGQFFRARGIDPEALADGGFVERRGRFDRLLVGDGDDAREVTVRSSGRRGWLVYDHPVDNTRVEVPAADAEKYAIKRDWVTEVVHKRLKTHLVHAAAQAFGGNLTYLGVLVLGTEQVPCYLARDLRTPATLQQMDIVLRSRSGQGVGLVLSTGHDNPLCLGPNVVVAMVDFLADSEREHLLDVDRLASAFAQGKQLARGGMVVDLVKQNNYSATLYIPGKAPLPLSGPKAIGFFEALVAAYRRGSPAVPTKTLMSAAGAASGSPSQLLGMGLWNSVFNVYVGFPPGAKRGSYQLLV